MLKLNISYSKKVPGKEQYSSISFHGSLEKELADNLSSEQIQNVFHESSIHLQSMIEKEIENCPERQNSQIKSPAQTQLLPPNPPNNQAPVQSYTTPQNTTSQASQKQITFLNRLGAERGLSQQQIDAMALNNFGAENIWQLSKKQASQLIEQLQRAA